MARAIRHNPNATRFVLVPVGCVLAMQVFAFDAVAQGGSKMLAFQNFYQSVANARLEDYAKKDGVKVTNPDEFQKMKAHVASTYEGVKVKNSFVLGEGDTIDCVDMRTQPALRQDGKFMAPAKPPAPMIAKEKRGDEARQGQQVAPMLSAKKKDSFGNVQYCDKGFIPMRRITLDELVRYETLADFFNKYGKAGEKGLPVPERK
jgi:hypothetical protein